VRWLRGLGSAGVANGGFAAQTVRSTGLRPQFISLADFNRDGRLDVATSNEGSSDISILFGGCDSLPPPAPPLPVGRWAENGVALCEAPGVQHTPDGAPDGTGGAIFAWVDGRSGGAHDIYASGLATDGDLAPGWIPNGNPVCSADGIQSYPRVVSDGMGGALLAWIDGRNGATALYAQHLLSSGGRRDLRDPEERGRE
jgi:hypothetical protein